MMIVSATGGESDSPFDLAFKGDLHRLQNKLAGNELGWTAKDGVGSQVNKSSPKTSLSMPLRHTRTILLRQA